MMGKAGKPKAVELLGDPGMTIICQICGLPITDGRLSIARKTHDGQCRVVYKRNKDREKKKKRTASRKKREGETIAALQNFRRPPGKPTIAALQNFRRPPGKPTIADKIKTQGFCPWSPEQLAQMEENREKTTLWNNPKSRTKAGHQDQNGGACGDSGLRQGPKP